MLTGGSSPRRQTLADFGRISDPTDVSQDPEGTCCPGRTAWNNQQILASMEPGPGALETPLRPSIML